MLACFVFVLGVVGVALIAYVPAALLIAWVERKGPVP